MEKDIYKWLRYYFASTFSYEPPPQQREMIGAILTAMEDGGDQALAASRGEGKSTISECILTYLILTGKSRFAVLFCATAELASNSISEIKEHIRTNDRLCADYPEACHPVRCLEGAPQRAKYMLARGCKALSLDEFDACELPFDWGAREVVFPSVPGAPSAGAIIATRGLDGAVRGLKINGRRPDVAVLDDPETAEGAISEETCSKLEKKIDRQIAGLAGQKRTLARIMLTTIQHEGSVSAKYTDPQHKPSWHGVRYRFLVEPPVRADLWEIYVDLKQRDWREKSNDALEHFVSNRDEMERGAVVANPNRYAQGELSALQHYYNLVARLGQEAVDCEYNNQPPDAERPLESALTAHRIMKQLSGYGRGEIPTGCTVLTRGIDVRKTMLHWVVMAWRPDGTGFVIDYGISDVVGTVAGSDEGVDRAVKRAILDLAENPGEYAIPITRTLVDAGWRTEACYDAALEAQKFLGRDTFFPVMGFGKSTGCVRTSFTDATASVNKKPGNQWFLSRKGKVWLVCMNADHWKAYLHDRWLSAANLPGSMYLFGKSDPHLKFSLDEKQHNAFAHHIVSEVEVEEVVKNITKRFFKAKSRNTHYLDSSVYATVAADMLGISVLNKDRKVVRTGERKPLSELLK